MRTSALSRHSASNAEPAGQLPARSVARQSTAASSANFDFASLSVNGRPLQRKLAVGALDDRAEAEADRVAERVMRMPDPSSPNSANGSGVLQRKCEACEDEDKVQRKVDGVSNAMEAPAIVHDVISSPGQPLDGVTRAFMEPRFGHDFSRVRVHTDARAAQSAGAVNARAYTVGNDVVFNSGSYAPYTREGRQLLAHELAHAVQQGNAGSSLRRTPANKVSCSGNIPLHVPGAPPLDVADPVGVITAAERRANEILEDSIGTLTFTRSRIIAGAHAGFPTVGDATGLGVSLLGINPNSDAAWKGDGIGTVGLLIRRLTAIRRTIGAGSFFFTCIGPDRGTIPALPGSSDPGCAGVICEGGNNAASCAGSFRIILCPAFWREAPERQAETLLHETSHNFAEFVQDRGREGNAGCYARCAQVIAGVDPAFQRADLCPDP